MQFAFTLFTYSFLFTAVYVQLFLLLTLFEYRGKINKKPDHFRSNHPGVTIIVPVFNENGTVEKTIDSILALNYPKDKLNIMIVDDGSTDNTWDLIQKFAINPQIKLHRKENGGKYTALNYAIERCTTDFVGCLDADSFVDKEALNHLMSCFKDPQIMAATPSLKIQNPDTIIRLLQNAEYSMGVFIRELFGRLDAQYVTPGPFSIFRKKVFSKIGMYHHAHNTEDLEMALRLQKHHFKIKNAHKAIVYTVGPPTLYKLYKQRVRWTGGFMQNVIDYRQMILNPKYGHLGMLVLPSAIFAIFGTIFFLSYSAYHVVTKGIEIFQRAQIVGWQFKTGSFVPHFSVDWIYYNIQANLLIGMVMIGLITFAIYYGKRLTESGDNIKDRRVFDVLCYFCLYSFIAPLWLITSIYNTVRSRDAKWR